MDRYIVFFLFCVFFIFESLSLQAQPPSDSLHKARKVVVKMKDGEEYKGFFYKKEGDIIYLSTANGELQLLAENVKSIQEDRYRGKFTFPNPHYTRYFFGPSAIPLKKNTGYYQNVYVTTNFANYGVTDNISIGGGFEFISAILGSPILFFTPKIGFEVGQNMHAGGGVIMVGAVGAGSAALGYGVFTYGNTESNVSVGAGYGIVNSSFGSYPTMMISGTHRLGKNVSILSENYLIPFDDSYTVFGIHGIRLLSEKSAFDLGAIVIPSFVSILPAIPFVGFARVF